jgi:hypothetical protein
MLGTRTIDSIAKKSKIKEGTLVRISYSPSVKVSIQDPVVGHLMEITPSELSLHPLVGIITKVWGNREFELMCSGEFFVISTNNGFEDSAINPVGQLV